MHLDVTFGGLIGGFETPDFIRKIGNLLSDVWAVFQGE
jgi:hypothetical protein